MEQALEALGFSEVDTESYRFRSQVAGEGDLRWIA